MTPCLLPRCRPVPLTASSILAFKDEYPPCPELEPTCCDEGPCTLVDEVVQRRRTEWVGSVSRFTGLPDSSAGEALRPFIQSFLGLRAPDVPSRLLPPVLPCLHCSHRSSRVRSPAGLPEVITFLGRAGLAGHLRLCPGWPVRSHRTPGVDAASPLWLSRTAPVMRKRSTTARALMVAPAHHSPQGANSCGHSRLTSPAAKTTGRPAAAATGAETTITLISDPTRGLARPRVMTDRVKMNRRRGATPALVVLGVSATPFRLVEGAASPTSSTGLRRRQFDNFGGGRPEPSVLPCRGGLSSAGSQTAPATFDIELTGDVASHEAYDGRSTSKKPVARRSKSARLRPTARASSLSSRRREYERRGRPCRRRHDIAPRA